MTPYEVLGVSPDASQEEIRRAYLMLARRHHPDAGGEAEDMRRLNEAWAALSSAPAGPAPRFAADVRAETTTDRERNADVDAEPAVPYVRHARSSRLRLLDSLTLLALLAWVVSAGLSFLFGMLFESGPLLGFCVFSLFMAGVFIAARTLLAMGFDRTHAS